MIKIILKIIIAVIITILIFTMWIKAAENAVCVNPDHNILITELKGTPNINLDETTKYTKITLDIAVPCGIYKGSSNFGDIKLLIGKYDGFNRQGYVYFNKKIMNNQNNIINMWDLVRLKNINKVVEAYNKGCC
jgi:hypothetical protein